MSWCNFHDDPLRTRRFRAISPIEHVKAEGYLSRQSLAAVTSMLAMRLYCNSVDYNTVGLLS